MPNTLWRQHSETCVVGIATDDGFMDFFCDPLSVAGGNTAKQVLYRHPRRDLLNVVTIYFSKDVVADEAVFAYLPSAESYPQVSHSRF